MEFVLSVLGLFDHTVSAILSVAIFQLLLAYVVFATAVQVFQMLRDAAK